MKSNTRILLNGLMILSISAVSARADWVTATVAVGKGPCAMAINPVTNRVVIALDSAGCVYALDGATHKTSWVAYVKTPKAVAINPFTGKIYVASDSGNSVKIINGANVVDSISVPVGANPRAIAVNAVTNKIYVANYTGNSVTVIDGATKTTATVAVGANPCAMTINPVSNKIYVANYTGNSITVIDGASNDTLSVAAGANPMSIAVNSITNKIYAANYSGNSVTAIDGATNIAASITTGIGPCAVAVNPVTNRIYVATQDDNGVTVIDGATNEATKIAVGTAPCAIAINTVTNKIYIANANGNTITVIDGATNATSMQSVGSRPWAIAVNPLTNKIYSANHSGGSVTAIDGASYTVSAVNTGVRFASMAINPLTNKLYGSISSTTGSGIVVIDSAMNTTTLPSVQRNGALAMAINPVTNMIYTANYSDGNVTAFNGATNKMTTIDGGWHSPIALAVNPITNRVYVANRYARSGYFPAYAVTMIDGATNATKAIGVSAYPNDIAVNPVTNRIYVVNDSANSLTVIDGASNNTTVLATGKGPGHVAVNPVTNKIYVSNYDDNSITVIDGATNSTKTVYSQGANPKDIVVNAETNKIYFLCKSNIGVIDGATNTASAIGAGLNPWEIAVNPVFNKIYVVLQDSILVIDGITDAATVIKDNTSLISSIAVNPVTGKVYCASATSVKVLDEAAASDTKVLSIAAPPPGFRTTQTNPIIIGKGVNRWLPKPVTRIEGVVGGLCSAQQSWVWNTITSGSGSDSVQWTLNWGAKSLILGENLVVGAALESQAATVNCLGLGTPFTGNLTVCPIYRVVEPPAAPSLVWPQDNEAGVSVTPTVLWNRSTTNHRLIKYGLQVSKDADFSDLVVNRIGIPDTFFAVPALDLNAKYYWRVVTEDSIFGPSEWSATRSFTTRATPLSAPALISPQCGALNVPLPLRISWNSVGGAIFYRVQVSAVRDFKTVVNDTSGIVDTSVAVKGLANTTRYYWRVNATDEGHSISDWSAACSLMTFPVAPSIVKLLWPQDRQTFTNPSDSVRCRWTMGGAREITAYRLEMATDSAFVKIIVDSTVSDTVAWVRKLANKTTYWWRVQARNAAGAGPVSAVSCFSINFATTATLPREYGFSFSGLHAQGGVIKYALPRKSSVSLRIVNPKGQSVFVHESSNQEPGRYSIPLNGRSLSPTCYIVIFKAGTFEMKRRLMVIE